MCSVPLRVGLLALDGLAADGSGVAKAELPITTAAPTSCPPGTVAVGGGSYSMGSKRVDVGPFCLDKTEVTAADYSACVDAGKCSAPEKSTHALCNYRKSGKETHPINCVTLEDAKKYCQSKGLLVPSQEQWVWATRGNAQRAYAWGEDEEMSRVCGDRKSEGTCEVSANPSGASPEGALNLVGNVAEFVESGTNSFRAMGGDFSKKSVKEMRPYSGRGAESAPEIGFRCTTK